MYKGNQKVGGLFYDLIEKKVSDKEVQLIQQKYSSWNLETKESLTIKTEIRIVGLIMNNGILISADESSLIILTNIENYKIINTITTPNKPTNIYLSDDKTELICTLDGSILVVYDIEKIKSESKPKFYYELQTQRQLTSYLELKNSQEFIVGGRSGYIHLVSKFQKNQKNEKLKEKYFDDFIICCSMYGDIFFLDENLNIIKKYTHQGNVSPSQMLNIKNKYFLTSGLSSPKLWIWKLREKRKIIKILKEMKLLNIQFHFI